MQQSWERCWIQVKMTSTCSFYWVSQARPGYCVNKWSPQVSEKSNSLFSLTLPVHCKILLLFISRQIYSRLKELSLTRALLIVRWKEKSHDDPFTNSSNFCLVAAHNTFAQKWAQIISLTKASIYLLLSSSGKGYRRETTKRGSQILH